MGPRPPLCTGRKPGGAPVRRLLPHQPILPPPASLRPPPRPPPRLRGQHVLSGRLWRSLSSVPTYPAHLQPHGHLPLKCKPSHTAPLLRAVSGPSRPQGEDKVPVPTHTLTASLVLTPWVRLLWPAQNPLSVPTAGPLQMLCPQPGIPFLSSLPSHVPPPYQLSTPQHIFRGAFLPPATPKAP